MNKLTMSNQVRVLAVAAATAMLAVGAGCSSKKKQAPAEPMTEGEHNRQLVNMALQENIYNGIASERAVYPKDFNTGTANLNTLGRKRVDALLHASRGAKGKITIIRGDETDEIYTARVGTVRQEFASNGVNVEQINVVKGDHVEGGGISSGQAILIFDRMLQSYTAQQQAGGPAANASNMGPTGAGTNVTPNP